MHPIPGRPVTQPFRAPGPQWRACGWHTGVDVPAPAGTPVLACRPGTVRHVDHGPAFGSHQVEVQCDDGTADFYAHLSARAADGRRIAAGQQVGAVGAEGNATGPHLHLERSAGHAVWSCGTRLDPMESIGWEDDDMTPEECRAVVRQELKAAMADIGYAVWGHDLHDSADSGTPRNAGWLLRAIRRATAR